MEKWIFFNRKYPYLLYIHNGKQYKLILLKLNPTKLLRSNEILASGKIQEIRDIISDFIILIQNQFLYMKAKSIRGDIYG